MMFGTIISSPRSSLSLQQILELAHVYLDNAHKATDLNVALVLCHDVEVALSRGKKAAKRTSDKAIQDGVATVYFRLAGLLDSHGHRAEAQAFFKKAEKFGKRKTGAGAHRPARPARPASNAQSIESGLHTSVDTTPVDRPLPHPPSILGNKQFEQSTATLPQNIFSKNVRPVTLGFSPPEPDSGLNDTPQLACCLGLLHGSYELDEILDPATRTWLQTTKNEPDEIERLETLATDVLRAFKRDEFKDAKSVTEVVYLAPVLDKDDFRYLFKEFYSGIDQSDLLDVHQLEGIAQLVQGARPDYLDTDDLVKVLKLLSTRLKDTHWQSTDHIYQLTLAVSRVLDAMADAKVKGLEREKIHEPLTSYLAGLKCSKDTYLVYQAAYAYQALLCVPDDESLWQATIRRTGKVMQGLSGVVSAVKGLDLNGFISGLVNIQAGFAGASEIVQDVKDAVSLAEGGQRFFKCLKEGLSFDRKRAWYSALRGADLLIRDGQFLEFRRLVCEAPCRRDAAFQWGVCQRLGEVVTNSTWDSETRQSAIEFLREIYWEDTVWGHQTNVKQWIVNILMQLSSIPSNEKHFIEIVLRELSSDTTKQSLYRVCRDSGPGNHPLKNALPTMGSPSLLDRVQQIPDVDGQLRHLRRQRLNMKGNVVYISPQAKASLHAHDDAVFPLMGKVKEFLDGEQRVFLLLGDSGAGKSTFNRELEYSLWQSYKKNGPIPLHINLPAIDKPEHDMIAKQLRKCEFTEPQIRELKIHRNFILICDGYDESQQTHNLYISNRLNQLGEWNAKMVISCRSEYIGLDYRDRFQPEDRSNTSETVMLHEAVITPFSMRQVQEYITQYVSVHRPLWEVADYRKALDLVPSLKELVKNPFLMTLSLEVLPRIVDPGLELSATHVTRMALYDQFIEHWMERGKKRVGEKTLSSQARAAFEGLIDEGFTRNGIDYLKKLSAAIYREQGGQPIVIYSRYKDENTWKSEFFSRDHEKLLLREACPLIRNGNQHRFIHRSILEYGVSLAIFDPQDWKERKVSGPMISRRMDRRGGLGSLMNSREQELTDEVPANSEQGPGLDSPLAWISFVNEPSVLQFLEERVQQESLFKQQLLEYIELSKKDKKWCIAASNAITVLVRAGVQFNNMNLQGIRIPKADISYGKFESAQLQGADLRQVDLRGAWLRRTNLSNAQMRGAQFGELPFLKQDGDVKACLYSPDGKTIAVGLKNGKINTYSTLKWEPLSTMVGHSKEVMSIMYSPTSIHIVSCSMDGTARLWDVQKGFCFHTLNGHDDCVSSVAYSPRGDQVVTASHDKTMKLWDASTGCCCHIWIGHTDIVTGLAFAPHGNTIATQSNDCTVRLWDVKAETCLHVLRGHTGPILSISYSPQGDKIVSASEDAAVRLWNTVSGECMWVYEGHSNEVLSVKFSPKGDQIASCGFDKSVRLWHIATGACPHTLEGHTCSVTSLVYSPQGDMVASNSNDGTVRLWDTETGVCRQTFTLHSRKVLSKSVAFSPKGDQVATGNNDMTIGLWDVEDAGSSRSVSGSHSGWISMIDHSPKKDHVVTCGFDMTARLWDVETGVCCQVLRGHTNYVKCAAYSPDGNEVATGGEDKEVRLWKVATGACIRVLTGHEDPVTSVAYSPRGDQFASAGLDMTIRLWDLTSGECFRTLNGHVLAVSKAIFLPNGDQIASCGWDSTARIWDVETGVCHSALSGHEGYVYDIIPSPRGDLVLTCGIDKTVRVWDVATGECRQSFSHEVYVPTIAYSPNSNHIISCSVDGVMRAWDLGKSTCLWTSGHKMMIYRCVYSPRGNLIATGSKDNSVRVWDATSGECQAELELQAWVLDLTWIESSNGVDYLIAGCSDGVVAMWQVSLEAGQCHVSLRWRTTKGELDVMDTDIQGALGLNQLNRQLLKQRGAIGEPIHRLREASFQLVAMSHVTSKLKAITDKAEEDAAAQASASEGQLEQRIEHVKDPRLRGVLSAFARVLQDNLV